MEDFFIAFVATFIYLCTFLTVVYLLCSLIVGVVGVLC